MTHGLGRILGSIALTLALTACTAAGHGGPSSSPVIPRAAKPNVVVNKIYVTSFKSAKVRVFLTNGSPTTPKIKTQLHPAGVVVASNGDIFVANYGANTVTAYDPTGKTISPTITGLSGPFALALDPNGLLDVLNQTSATITKYTTDGTLVGTIDLLPSTTSNGFAVAPDGSFWVSSSSDGNMLHLDAGGNLIQSFSVGGAPAGVALPGDGSVLFADTTGNDVGRLDPTTGNVTTFVSGLAKPVGLAIDGNGNVYVSNSGNNTVTTYDSSGNASTPTLLTNADPLGIAVQ